MRICAAQLRPVAGDVAANIAKHLALVELAASLRADLVFFPELSLTGYEPGIANSLASHAADRRFDVLQQYSDANRLIIAVGMPIAAGSGVQIGMIWFAPGVPRRTYAKQQLHADELRFFIGGSVQLVLESCGTRLAPAICFESLQEDHADNAARLGADVYLASVAKPARNLAKALDHHASVARRHGMWVMMANCTGPNHDFISAGHSAAWNAAGEQLAQMDGETEGVVVLDTLDGVAAVHGLANG